MVSANSISLKRAGKLPARQTEITEEVMAYFVVLSKNEVLIANLLTEQRWGHAVPSDSDVMLVKPGRICAEIAVAKLLNLSINLAADREFPVHLISRTRKRIEVVYAEQVQKEYVLSSKADIYVVATGADQAISIHGYFPSDGRGGGDVIKRGELFNFPEDMLYEENL
jgi:hypothetical protein